MKRQKKADKPRPLTHFAQLIERFESTVNWEDLTLPESERQHLQEIAEHIKHRGTIAESFGHTNRTWQGPGVIALFAGPTGTGKTMAAGILANALNLQLYRIDLSSVVSKYIGETEKNLQRVFDAAEEKNAILLFDEADALFGKRSEVKDSHHRYADQQISYLFQRIESFRGLTILSSNMKKDLYQTVLRRILFVIEFPKLTE